MRLLPPSRAFVLSLACLSACASAPGPKAEATPAAPAFSVKDSAGHDWTQVSGAKPLLIDFWATWCRPCVDAFPALKAFQEKHGAKVQLLGLAIDSQGWSVVEPVRKRWDLNYPVAVAPAALSVAYGAPGYPYLALVKNGKIVKKLLGKHTLAELEFELADTLK